MPPSLPAYLVSLLSRQLALGSEAFSRRYPNSWLVWEAGGSVGRLSDVKLSVVETSLAEVRASPQRPRTGDALCFVLKTLDGEPLRVGRAVDNELVVPEPTISRLHARLELQGDAWHLLALSQKRQTIVAGRLVDPDTSVQLVSGQTIELGGVRFGFYDAKALKARVSAVPLRPAQ